MPHVMCHLELMLHVTLNLICIALQEMESAGDGNEEMPPAQRGFRRMLAGIYTHTSGHITAAPMAHWVALNGCRFRYSHAYHRVPIFPMEKYLLDMPLTMRFKRSCNGKRMAFHECMHYLFRPQEMENMCCYAFYQDIEIVSDSEAKKEGLETFLFTKEHPCKSFLTTTYRPLPAIPAFAWNFLPSTRNFESPILDPIDSSSTDYEDKEEYSRRFLMLFLPFRELEDLNENGSCTCRLQKAHARNEIDDAMLAIANQIQNIHNSLESAMVEACLHQETDSPDIEECETNHPNDFDVDMIRLMNEIGDALAPGTEPRNNDPEFSSFNPTFARPNKALHDFHPGNTCFGKLDNCFRTSRVDPPVSNNSTIKPVQTRFQTKTSTLNQLILQSFLNEVPPQENTTKTNSNDGVAKLKEKWKPKATGTWESIVSWGRVAELDKGQQTAFEVMAATFVLGFIEEKENDTKPIKKLSQQTKSLKRLAQRSRTDARPLQLFITGPAGAGKCRSFSSRNTSIPCYEFRIQNSALPTILFVCVELTGFFVCLSATILEEVVAYARQFSQHIGYGFHRGSIRLTALTGSAATEIGGETTAREFQLKAKKTHATIDDINNFSDI